MLSLRSGDVHLWRVDLDAGANDGAGCSVLEWTYAGRLLTAAGRSRYLCCRSALRRILARYTGLAVGELVLRTGPFGKPELEPCALHFNVSHSEGMALIGVATEPLGVDIESIGRPGLDLDGTARLVFHQRECDWLAGLRGNARRDAFFRIWTSKEAYCKALGVGMHKDLREVYLEQHEQGPVMVVRDPGCAPHFIHVIAGCAHQYAASVCTARRDSRIAMHSFEEGSP